jgi:hypothetical protein
MELLSKKSSYIDTPKALRILPQDIPIQQLQGYLTAVLRENSSKRRNGQVWIYSSLFYISIYI